MQLFQSLIFPQLWRNCGRNTFSDRKTIRLALGAVSCNLLCETIWQANALGVMTNCIRQQGKCYDVWCQKIIPRQCFHGKQSRIPFRIGAPYADFFCALIHKWQIARHRPIISVFVRFIGGGVKCAITPQFISYRSLTGLTPLRGVIPLILLLNYLPVTSQLSVDRSIYELTELWMLRFHCNTWVIQTIRPWKSCTWQDFCTHMNCLQNSFLSQNPFLTEILDYGKSCTWKNGVYKIYFCCGIELSLNLWIAPFCNKKQIWTLSLPCQLHSSFPVSQRISQVLPSFTVQWAHMATNCHPVALSGVSQIINSAKWVPHKLSCTNPFCFVNYPRHNSQSEHLPKPQMQLHPRRNKTQFVNSCLRLLSPGYGWKNYTDMHSWCANKMFVGR